MITQKQMETMDITHHHAGNGYAVCQGLDKDYVRLTPVDGNYWTEQEAHGDIELPRCIHGEPRNIFCPKCEG